jgi:hypothetical protein
MRHKSYKKGMFQVWSIELLEQVSACFINKARKENNITAPA